MKRFFLFIISIVNATNGYCRTFKQPGQPGAYVGKSAVYRVRAIRKF